ncbi:O-antigen ligase family protein [Rubrobacter aplysinae]|uniref:O-antigen ligase family protein n=1 Tax=Rubrobacter aplysinae TaxID=909625 RepID=UPI001F412EC2|nr:O-antigen ligase family protein [Rubrobacter aplysinae]
MGDLGGGYYVGEWGAVALILALLLLLLCVTGLLREAGSPWSVAALGLLTAYTAWTFASMLWSPNGGAAWLGAGQALLYLLSFLVAAALIRLGASRRWALASSVAGPGIVAALTFSSLPSQVGMLFKDNRLVGTVGYYNGEAAFLLVPFWVAVYLAGSRSINPVLRAGVLICATLCIELAVLTQSRGAMVALAVSALVFFVFSGERLRGLLALLPVAVAVAIAFPALNEVYLRFLDGESPGVTLDRVILLAWASAAGAGLYGLLWGLLDRRWTPPQALVRMAGAATLVCAAVLCIAGLVAVDERVGSPVALAQDKWEAFRTSDTTGQDQSRFLSASGTGRFPLWEVAWGDFTQNPALGVGTQNYEATYYQDRDTVAGYVQQPHMLPLEILAERGLVGGVLFAGFMAVCVAAGLWERFTGLNAQGKAQVGALVAAVSYWFVHASAEWFWQLPAVTMPAFVYLAVLVLPWLRSRNMPAGWPLRAAGLGISVLAVAAILPLSLSGYYLNQSTNPTASTGEALTAVERAQTFNPLDPRPHQREAELALQADDPQRAETAYLEAARLNPEHYAPLEILAVFYQRQGETEKAREMYREAIELNPLDPELQKRAEELGAAS